MFCMRCGQPRPADNPTACPACKNASWTSVQPSQNAVTSYIDTTPGQKTVGAFDPPDAA